jgi:hypothetical protein
MHAAPATTRRTRDRDHARRPFAGPAGRWTVTLGAAGALLLAGLGAAGCSPSSVSALPSKATVTNELAARLDHGDANQYQASYRLAGGWTATVSQATGPIRHAWSFASAGAASSYTTTWSAATTCTGTPATCTLTAPPVLNDQPDIAAIFQASGYRFVSSEQLMSLLTNASMHRATVRGHSTTVAGVAAYCATASGGSTPGFTGCLTAGGALASFTGTVGGHRVDAVLTGVTPGRPAASAFETPAGATVVDHR